VSRAEAYDALVIGAGHNGLVAAALLARAGRSVLVLERAREVGGAAVSGSPFAGVAARISRFSYLVSLFPTGLARELGLELELRTRAVSSYTPVGDTGVLVCDDESATEASITRATGDAGEFERWQRLQDTLARMATWVAPTLTEPLPSRRRLRSLVGDDQAWTGVFERPLGEWLEHGLATDAMRGVALTDATIGTFAAARDPGLAQNRCFLYHVVGDGTGVWKVPVGGMGALTGQLAAAAQRAGAEIRTGAEVVSVSVDNAGPHEVVCVGGERMQARHVLANVAPAVLARLLGDPDQTPGPEGSQLKINMLLRRLPALRDPEVTPEQAFAGTFHVNEGYEQLQRAYEQAADGQIPSLPPCELYCHSLTDPSILSGELNADGVQTLTLFGLHMPARLFRADPHGAKRAAVQATLTSVNSVLAEPLEDCLLTGPDGETCLEAVTPVELETELAMPGGHIFHRDLTWPFADPDSEAGSWGTETARANVWLCGSGARRGGAVSGIPGHNAARAVLAADGG
jgi:phytoene dehydrogenase-like protein